MASRRISALTYVSLILVFWITPLATTTIYGATSTTPPRYFPVYPRPIDQPFMPGLDWGARLDIENIFNAHGGLVRNAVTDVIGNIGLTYNTEEAGLWQGGLFTAGITGVASGYEPKLAGELQTVSDLWALSTVRFSELSYKQQFNPLFLVRAGIMDFNYYFDLTVVGAELMNSSFGLTPTLYVDALVPTYHYSGWGAMSEIGSILKGRVGIFQGNPKELNTVFSQGYFAIGELEDTLTLNKQSLLLKAGAWRYRRPSLSWYNTYGFYGMAEDTWYMGKRQCSLFLQAGDNLQDANVVPYYVGGGVRVKPLFNRRPDDVFSLGVASVGVQSARQETAYEVTYVIRLTKQVSLQPDLQYVVNPGGTNPNALMGIVRVHADFS